VSKRYGKRLGRCSVAGFGIALAAVFIAIGPRVEDARIASIVLAGGAGALYLSQSMFWSVSSEIGGNSAGSVSGLMNMGNQIAGAVTASLSPIIAARFGWTSSFTAAAFLCALGALAWAFVDPEDSLIGRSPEAGARVPQAIGSPTGVADFNLTSAAADPNHPH
jgi:ACS family glucarate transporter-like MFS transporter